jgi:hypothetical protein
MEPSSKDNHPIIIVCDTAYACENKRDRFIDPTRNISGDKTMFNSISMKTISVTAITLSLLLGSLSTAFAKPAFNKSFSRNQEATVTSHRRNGLVYDGGSSKTSFRHSFRLGNRSISHQ